MSSITVYTWGHRVNMGKEFVSEPTYFVSVLVSLQIAAA